MSSTSQRYPLSTPDGISIPLDVIKPYSYILKSVGTTVSAAINIPAAIEIISFAATEDTIICFGGTAVAPPDGTPQSNTLFVQKGTRVTVAPPANTFTVLALGTAGYLHCQLIDKWAGLALQTQYSKR